MKLSSQDADLYFELMWSLLFFANQQLKLIPEVASIDEYRELSQDDKLQVRDELFGKVEMIDQYIQENPENFSKEELAIVGKWKACVKGEFYIERNLKNIPFSLVIMTKYMLF